MSNINEEFVNQSEAIPPKDNIFLGKPYIHRRDGWLSPEGIFFGCSSNQHEQCAKYIVKKILSKKLPNLEEESARKILSQFKFVQLNAGTVLTVTKVPLTEKQLIKINSANKRKMGIKIALSTIKPYLNRFEGMKFAYDHGHLDAEQQDLVREFFENDYYFRVNDDEVLARKLYNTLTLGFKEGPSFSRQFTYKRSQWYMISNDGTFAVELDEHIHDGQSGLYSTCWINIIDKNELDKIEKEYYGNDDSHVVTNPKEEYHEGYDENDYEDLEKDIEQALGFSSNK